MAACQPGVTGCARLPPRQSSGPDGRARPVADSASVRWEALFRDLEAQLEATEQAELADEVADRSRLEAARLRLADRLRAADGAELTLAVGAAGAVTGRIRRVGADWLLLVDGAGREALVPLEAVIGVTGLPHAAVDPERTGAVDRRLGLGYALRAIARDRTPVRVLLRDGGVLTGTVDRVGADYAEIAVHPLDEPRRPGAVVGMHVVAFGGVAVVHAAE